MNSFHLVVGNLDSGLMRLGVQFCPDPQSGLGSRGPDQVDDRLVTNQRVPLPVQTDEGEIPIGYRWSSAS